MLSLILADAEGVTWDEAVERGITLHPSEYAIPVAQADELKTLMTAHQGRTDKPFNVSMTWFNIGPATYES